MTVVEAHRVAVRCARYWPSATSALSPNASPGPITPTRFPYRAVTSSSDRLATKLCRRGSATEEEEAVRATRRCGEWGGEAEGGGGARDLTTCTDTFPLSSTKKDMLGSFCLARKSPARTVRVWMTRARALATYSGNWRKKGSSSMSSASDLTSDSLRDAPLRQVSARVGGGGRVRRASRSRCGRERCASLT